MKYWMISPDMHKHIIPGHSQAWFMIKPLSKFPESGYLTPSLVNKKKILSEKVVRNNLKC